MKQITFYLQIIALCLTVGMISCQNDDEIFDELINSEWTGQLGFTSRDGEPLVSELYFMSSGIGSDKQYDAGHTLAYNLQFGWRIEGGTLTLNYGQNYPLLEVRGMNIKGSRLNGTLYLDGNDSGRITLMRK